jgi:hypothetical protein
VGLGVLRLFMKKYMDTKRSKQYKLYLKKIWTWVFVVIFSLEQTLVPATAVFAQTATPSATPIETTTTSVSPTPTPLDLFDGPQATPSATPSPTVVFTPSITPTPTPTPAVNPVFDIPDYPLITPTPTPTIAPDLGVSTLRGSANFRAVAVTRALKRRDFRSIEPIDITVTNIVDPASQDVQVSLFDVRGNETAATIDPSPVNDGTTMFRIIPSDQIKPGKYTAKVFQNDVLISTQSFTWGVLAVNTNKSIFVPGEVATLNFAVLDETGNMVCDNSQLSVDITDPTGGKKTLSVADGTITVNSECQMHR